MSSGTPTGAPESTPNSGGFSAAGIEVSPELMQRVCQTIATAQKLPLEKVLPDATFEELGIDSLDGIQLLFALENEFSITIPDEEARKVRSIRGLAEGVAYLMQQQGGEQAPA